MIGTIPGDAEAERFSDYLLAQKIENMVEEGSNGAWSVWVEKDDDIERGKSELEKFLKNTNDARYVSASGAAARQREEVAAKKKKRRAQYIDVRTRWGQPAQWAAPLTLSLIALSAVISLGTKSMMGGRNANWRLLDPLLFTSVDDEKFTKWQMEHRNYREPLAVYTGYWLDHLKHGQLWRVFTPMFVHWNILHLLFNMFWLRDLGGMIEIKRGTWQLAWLVIMCALLAHVGEYFWSGVSAFGGMSGVVYGLFGYVWIKDRFEPHLGLGISPQASMIMIGWLIICMLNYMGNVANAAHVVGMLTGAAVAYMPYLYRQKIRARR